MGTSELQAKSLIIHDSEPMFYTLRLNLSKISRDKILFLSGSEWIYTVVACRKKSNQFNNLKIASEILNNIQSYDLIVGPIADDQMSEAMRQFNAGFISDTALEDCLNYVDYGYQFVAKSQYACDCIDVISESEIYENEADQIEKYLDERRIKGQSFVSDIAARHRTDGMYINDIINNELHKEEDSTDVVENVPLHKIHRSR